MISFICSSKYSSSILSESHRTGPLAATPAVRFCRPVAAPPPVGLVQDQDLDVAQLEARCVVKVVDQSARCGDQNIWTRPQSRLL